jgi:hypothetical protein
MFVGVLAAQAGGAMIIVAVVAVVVPLASAYLLYVRAQQSSN